MRSLACSLADGGLADAILISSCPTLPATNIRKGRGCQRSIETSNRKNSY